VKNIGREDTQIQTCTLQELADADADMFTTVFVGNSQSFIRDGKLITKRGYSI
jgi:precorrin-3B C17-methyltransferase